VSKWSWSYARSRKVVLSVPQDALFERVSSTGRSALTLSALRSGMQIWLASTPFAPSWVTQRATAGVLALEHLTLR
jgi:hypothetical protein